MDETDQILKITFLEEAVQLLDDAEQCFLQLESSPGDMSLIDRIFRVAHNIKGSAKAVGFPDLGQFIHELESVLLKLRNREMAIDPEIVEIFLSCHDLLCLWIKHLKDNFTATIDYLPLLRRLQGLNAGVAASKPTSESGFAIFDEAGPAARPSPPAEGDVPPAPGLQDDSIRISLGHVDALVNDIGELVILQTVLRQQKHLIDSPLIQKTIDQLAKITRQIQDASMKLRMVPLQQTFHKMQRILRDTAKALGKEVSLHIAGEATGLDKTVLDNLGDPLVHLIRNAVDHGIEMPEERQQLGKSPRGHVGLSAFHHSGKLVIEIRDDGRGLNPAHLMSLAKKRGILAQDMDLADEAACQLIFTPGFSSKSEVTDISGRGVGLDVVKTNIQRLKGEIQLENRPGLGCTFRILLPLTLAIIEGMVIELNETERYVIPLSQVHEIFEITGAELHALGHDQEMFDIRGRTLPFYNLARFFGRPYRAGSSRGVVIVSRIQQQEYAFAADRIRNQQQVVIKQLGRDLRKIHGVSGSAILGDGKAALILDLEEIAKGRSA